MVGWLTSTASAMRSSVQAGPSGPWSALSRMRAWISLRAGATPAPIRVIKSSRSVGVSTTGYFLFIPRA